MKIGCTLRVGLSLQIFRYDEQVESWQILALRVWHNQAYASSLPEQTKRGRGAHRQGSSRGLEKACRRAWRARHVCGVTKSSTTTTSHQVWDQTSHHTSNTLSLVSPSFLLSWHKQGEYSTLFLRFDFHYIDLSSFRQASVCFSVISVKLLTFYRKIWFQTNHISSGTNSQTYIDDHLPYWPNSLTSIFK